ncbi:TGS domain-containing protein [Thermoflexus hugenholtzii]
MEALEDLPGRFQRQIAEETYEVFLPVLELLGMWDLRHQLGDRCLRFLNREKWERTHRLLTASYHELEPAVHSLLQRLERELPSGAHLKWHRSTPFGLLQRARTEGEAADLARLIKVDGLLPSVEACYQALAVLHRYGRGMFSRHPATARGRPFVDRIAWPRFNGYRALITRLLYPHPFQASSLLRVEFRLFTSEMEQVNRWGIVAARYQRKIQGTGAWWENEDLRAFLRERPPGSISPQIYVFSPSGEAFRLPGKSTPRDFAFAIALELGQSYAGARVNGHPVGPDHLLCNGDVVEIRSSPAPRPASPSAERRIRRVLEREAQYLGLELEELEEKAWTQLLENVAWEMSRRRKLERATVEALYQAVGEGRISPDEVVDRFLVYHLARYIVQEDGSLLSVGPEWVRFARFTDHRHDGLPCRVRFQEPIIGRWKTKGKVRLFQIYRRDCPRAPSPEEGGIPLRWVRVERSGVLLKVQLRAIDRPRLLDEVLHPIYELYAHGFYMLECNARTEAPRDQAQIDLILQAPNLESWRELEKALADLDRKGVRGRFHPLNPLAGLRLADVTRIPNPYTLAPTCDLFFGRWKEEGWIKNWLLREREPSQSVFVIHGPSRIGKTSFLLRLQQLLGINLDLSRAYAPIQVSLASARSFAELAQAIDQELYRLLSGERRKTVTPTPDPERMMRRLEQQLETIARERRPLLMLDEATAFLEWPEEDQRRLVASLITWGERFRMRVILACHPRPPKRETRRPLDAPLLELLERADTDTLTLGPLEQEAALQLIREPLRGRLLFDERTTQEILELSGCHPYYLQLLLRTAVDYANAKGLKQIRAHDLDEIVQELFLHGRGYFLHWLQEDEEEEMLYWLARLLRHGQLWVSKEEAESLWLEQIPPARRWREQRRLRSLIARLLQKGALQYDPHQGLRFTVPLFQRWLQDYGLS